MTSIPVKLFLRSTKKAHPDIPLSHMKSVEIGRSPQTKIKDTKVSKKHLRLLANCFARSVQVTQLGANPSWVQGSILKTDETRNIAPNDILELGQDDHRYELIMEAPKATKDPSQTHLEDRALVHPGHWSMALIRAIKDDTLKLFEDDSMVVIRDAYPKARQHYLVVAKDSIDSLKEMDLENVALLEQMIAKGHDFKAKHPDLEFRLGFHAIPSMARLHLHVVSQDFDSPCLKNLKHWNSFTSEFFVPADVVLAKIKSDGVYPQISGEESKKLLSTPLLFAMPNLKLGDVVPDFKADTTDGSIQFHDWIGDSWAVLFSHPADFTPVCTTELGRVESMSGEFQKRGIKLIALSCDDVESHKGWIEDIKAYNNLSAFSYPIISDPKREVATLYGMMDPDEKDAAGMPLTCRAVFVIGADKKLKLAILYPATTGRNFDEILRVIDSLQLTATKKVATPADWKQGGSCMVIPSVKNEEAEKLFPKGFKVHDVPSGKQYIRTTEQPE
ncbi:hypothetical protein TCAL_09184 [Tigriopus californicus]|uniref:1-Cys peroxiredoxin n=2 Tax=Tigriopus californicus TaxID=6832 RepID=A0A553PAK1_TIGCA|nr:hypothetical protein TCAL_09184 [Tigriopus californicus]